jgi:hypothetical protein
LNINKGKCLTRDHYKIYKGLKSKIE